jgi:hypothetical protein
MNNDVAMTEEEILQMTDEEIIQMVLENSRLMAERQAARDREIAGRNARQQLIAEQDEEYRKSLEMDRAKAAKIDEVVVLEDDEDETYDFDYVDKETPEAVVDDPQEGDLKSLREARLRFFQK